MSTVKDKYPTANKPGKNLIITEHDFPPDAKDLLRFTPCPDFSNKPLYFELIKNSKFGRSYAEECRHGFKRSTDPEADFLETLALGTDDDEIKPSDWTDNERTCYRIAFLHVMMNLMAPKFYAYPIHWCDLHFLHWNWDSSSCWPYCLDRLRRSKRSAWNKFTQFGRDTIHNIKGFNPASVHLLPLVLGHYFIMGYHRFHLAAIDSFAKVRLVFGMPFIVIASEMQLFAGYMYMLKQYRTSPIAYGRETLRGGMVYLNSQLRHDHLKVCDDISKFDLHVYFFMVVQVYLFAFNNYIKFSRYWPMLKSMGIYLNSNQIAEHIQRKRFYCVVVTLIRWLTELRTLLPTGAVMIRQFQIWVSGCFLTTWIDSCINCIVLYTSILVMGLPISCISFIVLLADDITFTVDFRILHESGISCNEFFRQFNATRKRLFNMHSNAPIYLGFDNNKVVFLHYRNEDGRPIRSVKELASGSFNRERHLLPQHIASHNVGLAWAAAGSDRDFHDCCQAAYDFAIRVGNDKGIEQSVDMTDHFNVMLIETLGIPQESLTMFPTYEEVLSKVTTYDPAFLSEPHRSLPSDVFLHPDASLVPFFEPFSQVSPPIFQDSLDDLPDYIDNISFYLDKL